MIVIKVILIILAVFFALWSLWGILTHFNLVHAEDAFDEAKELIDAAKKRKNI